MEYFIQIGDVTTDTKPVRPTQELVQSWITEFLQEDNPYKTYLVGSYAEKTYGTYDGTLYDVDVVLVGTIEDEAKLRVLLNRAIEIGFSHNLMIDIWHNDKLMNLHKKEGIVQTRSYDKVYSKITIKGREFESTTTLWGGLGTSLPSGLFQYTYTDTNVARSWTKANDRIKSGKYKGVQIKIDKL